MRTSLVVAVLSVGSLAGCASSGAVPETAEAPRPVAAPAAQATPDAAPRVWEPWPPPERAARAPSRPAPSGDVVEIPSPPEGLGPIALLEFVTRETGDTFFYDEASNQKLRQARVQHTGAWRVPRSRLVDAARAVLSFHNVVIVPTGAGGGGAPTWFVLDQNNPMVKTRPVHLHESQVLDYEDAEGLYVVTSFRIRDFLDTGSVRQALLSLTTATANIGRIQDVASGQTVVVGDFAPVVATMKRLVDRMNHEAVPPPPDAPPKTPRK